MTIRSLCLLIALSAPLAAQQSGIYRNEPYNGIQIKYSIGGAAVKGSSVGQTSLAWGKTWRIREVLGNEYWEGVWTLRSDGKTFDAKFVNYPSGRAFDVQNFAVIRSFDGKTLVVDRPGYGQYVGQVSSDRKTITGGTCSWHAGGWSGGIGGQVMTGPAPGATPAAPPVVRGDSGSWEYVGIGDCPGNDIAGGGAGSVPDPQLCDSQHAGLVAVCWDSTTPRVMSPPACTIKSVRAENCTGGVNPGRMYRCNYQAATTEPSPGTTGAREKVFVDPKLNGRHIDNCLTWGANCQKPAADYFCRQNGFVEAVSFNLVNRRPTLVMGDGRVCDGEFCVGFSRIVCGGGTTTTTVGRDSQESVIFYNGNDAGVSPGGGNPRFSIDRPVRITYLFTYHYGYTGVPGNIRIMNATGAETGIWQAQGRSESPKPSWYWEIKPNVELQPGAYLVETSHPSSWSQNAGSGGNGIVQIKGVYLTAPQSRDIPEISPDGGKPTLDELMTALDQSLGSGNVDKSTSLIHPVTRSKYRQLFAAHPTDLARIAAALKSRVALKTSAESAEYEISEDGQKYVVEFRKRGGAWFLFEF